jgi:hypothetical protein
MAPRPNPAAASNGEAPEVEGGEKQKREKKPALYHIYDAEKLADARIGSYDAINAMGAIAAFIESGDQEEIAEQVTNGNLVVAVVPERNQTVASAQVQTKTKVKLSAV